MDFLHFIPATLFETIGVFAGLMGCFVITIQVWKEYKLQLPSSLSLGYVIGWVFIYLFWAFYGIRFETVALWLTNSIAVILQITLCVIIVKKNRSL